MKAEERKQLQSNTLAQTLGQTFKGFKEGPSRNTVLVLVLVGLALVLFFTYRFFSNAARETDSARWVTWNEIAGPEQLDAFLKDKDAEGTIQGRLARFLGARRALVDGLGDLGDTFQKTRAIDTLKNAASEYEKLIGESSDRPVLHQEALLGTAKAYEALGDYEKAKGFYKQLADRYGETARGKIAQKALERLDNPVNKTDLQDLKDLGKAPPAPTTP